MFQKVRQEPPSSSKSSSPEGLYEQGVAILRFRPESYQGPQPYKSVADAIQLVHCSEWLNGLPALGISINFSICKSRIVLFAALHRSSPYTFTFDCIIFR